MKTVKFLTVLFVSAVSLTIFLSTFSMAAETRTLSFSVWGGPNHWCTKAVQSFATDLEAATQGKIKVTVYPGGTLTKGANAYSGVVEGISDIATACNGWTKGRFPLAALLDLPLGFESPIQATLIVQDFYEKFRPKEFDDIKVLSMYNNSGQNLHTLTKPVRKLEDLKGLRIRSTGNDVSTVRALGAIPVSMEIGEAYIAFKKGIVDGIVCGDGGMVSFKLADVTRYHTRVGLTSASFWAGMNKDVWNSFPPDIQKIIEEVGEKFTKQVAVNLLESDKQAISLCKNLGHEFIELEPNEKAKFQEALSPVIKEYVQELEKMGLPGREALDYTLHLMKKYEGR